MSRSKKKAPRPRSPVEQGMWARYGRTTTVMKDRRTPRQGARNYQNDYKSGEY